LILVLLKSLKIPPQDTGGSYCYEFPSMVGVSLFSADAVVLVFSLADQDSFEELVRLRELVRQAKGETKETSMDSPRVSFL
jgi:hypothetical protein